MIYFARKTCTKILDLYMRYDKQMLVEYLWYLTMFQILFRAFRLIMLSIGRVNSVPIFYENITYILKEKISKYILLYINNVLVRELVI